MIQKIESRQNQKIKDLIKLSLPKYSKELRLFKIEGMHALEMAKKSGTLLSVFTTKELPDLHVPQYLVTRDVMESISCTQSPQGIICVCSYLEEEPIKSNKVLLLDNIQDPGNLGTLLRTALAFGYTDIILRGGCSQYNEKVLQSTQGAIFKLNIVPFIDEDQREGYEIIVIESMSDGRNLHSFQVDSTDCIACIAISQVIILICKIVRIIRNLAGQLIACQIEQSINLSVNRIV